MLSARLILTAAVLFIPLFGCLTARPTPLTEPITVHVSSADSLQPVQFNFDVTGGPAELRSPGMLAGGSNSRLTSGTPAEIVLQPGTTGAAFHAVGSGALHVTARGESVHLSAIGSLVRLVFTPDRLEIRSF